MRWHLAATACALSGVFVLWGCETPAPPQPAPDYAAISKNCLAEGGTLNSYAVSYYQCMTSEGQRLAPSGGAAAEIATAAAIACDAQRAAATNFAQVCRQYYASAAGLQVLQDFEARMYANGTGSATRAVLQSRMPANR